MNILGQSRRRLERKHMTAIKLKAIQLLRKKKKKEEECKMKCKDSRDLFIRVAWHILTITRLCRGKITLSEEIKVEEIKVDKIKVEEESRVFVFKENTESRLYREFLNKWEKTWTATELNEGEDEAKENCIETKYVEKRRSSKQMHRKSRHFIALGEI